MNINLQDSQVSILVEINGEIHLVGMDKEHLDTIVELSKKAISVVVPTGITQSELNEFLGYNS